MTRKSVLAVLALLATALLAVPGLTVAEESQAAETPIQMEEEAVPTTERQGEEAPPAALLQEEVLFSQEPGLVGVQYHYSCDHDICYTLCGPYGGYPVDTNLCLCC